MTVDVTPSEPKYYQYRFQGDESSLVIIVESDDDLCSVVSVQDVQVRLQQFQWRITIFLGAAKP